MAISTGMKPDKNKTSIKPYCPLIWFDLVLFWWIRYQSLASRTTSLMSKKMLTSNFWCNGQKNLWFCGLIQLWHRQKRIKFPQKNPLMIQQLSRWVTQKNIYLWSKNVRHQLISRNISPASCHVAIAWWQWYQLCFFFSTFVSNQKRTTNTNNRST